MIGHCLVVDDDADIRTSLTAYLQGFGWQVSAAADGQAMRQHLAAARPDVIVLDLMLPGEDGLSLCRDLRARDAAAIPILMLTARADEADRILGLEMGADDYLTKPFALPELEVRIEALIARVAGRGRNRILEVEDLRLDMATLEATRAGQPLHLYPACRKLLETLMQASPAAVSRERLEHALWGEDPPDGDMLRSHIYELRRSVDGPFPVKLIHTLPRVGYRLAAIAREQLDAI